MSQTVPPDADETVFLLHFLGGSARAWGGVAERLAPRRWALVGHSMGGKVAAVLARRAEDGEAGLAGLAAVVLLAASPAGPEPMDARQRAEMLGWFRGGAARGRAEAAGFVARNVASPLSAAVRARTEEDVVRADAAAWRGWLEAGSREDWAARVGVLRTPALVVAGAQDAALGEDAQRVLVAPAFAIARLATLARTGHLLPVERPAEVAALVAGFLDEVRGRDERAAGSRAAETRGAGGDGAGGNGAGGAEAGGDRAGDGGAGDGVAVGAAWRALLGSDRVSARTRAALLGRTRREAGGAAMSAARFATLRLVVDRMVPQAGGARIDLAARVDAVLASGVGDGWRMAGMPPDAEACAAGLDTLEAVARRTTGGAGFAGLADAAQDAMLGRVAAGTLDAGGDVGGVADKRNGAADVGGAGGSGAGPLDATRMRLWFEEVRSMAVRAYVAHPATLARMGYSGIGYGGDAARLEGFVRLGIGAREDWEPVAEAAGQAGGGGPGGGGPGGDGPGDGAASARGVRS